MSGVVWGDELPSPDPAIVIYRAPARHADLLHGRGILPQETPEILARAADAVRLGRPDALTEAHRAALFFAEHVLLAADADHYRVLGLGMQATGGEIRERYHLLMRVVHPDRCGWLGIDGERLAARLNLAYQTLRNVASRSAYDLSLRQAQLPRSSSAVPDPVVRHSPARRGTRQRSPAERLVGGLPPVLRRYFAQFVLASFGMIGMLMVATAYFSRPPEGAIGGRRSHAQVVKVEEAAGANKAAAQGDKVDVAEGRGASPQEPVRAMKPGVTPQLPPDRGGAAVVPEVTSRPVAVTVTPEAASRMGGAVAAGPDVVAVPSVSAAPVTHTPVSVSDGGAGRSGAEPAGSGTAPVMPLAAVPVASDAGAPAAVVIAAAQTRPRPEPQLGPDEARNAVRRFAELYQAGDIERFMELFSADARSASGHRADIRRDYEDLFRTTRSRRVELADFRWSLDKLAGHGDGAYYIRIHRNGESADEVFAGSLRVDLVKSGDRVLISGLFHEPAR